MFNLVEEVVGRHRGEDAWDALLERAGLGGAYTAAGSYPDDEALRLLDAAVAALGSTRSEVLRWFGREAIPMLAARYPGYFAGHRDARSFVLRVNGVVHPEVGNVYRGAAAPSLGFSDGPDGSLVMDYASPRRLCALAHGLVEGAADHFGETASFEHLRCMDDGAESCRCRIDFHTAQPATAA